MRDLTIHEATKALMTLFPGTYVTATHEVTSFNIEKWGGWRRNKRVYCEKYGFSDYAVSFRSAIKDLAKRATKAIKDMTASTEAPEAQ